MKNPKTATVKTPMGQYKGLDLGGVHAFKGIRYAYPISKNQRFAAPRVIEESSKLINATRFSKVAPQPGIRIYKCGEDCLSLNIWKKANSKGSRPVFFFVHGGTYIRGSGSDALYDGRFLAETYDIVVVTINYRLGILGFLDFSSYDSHWVPNPGIHDIIAALKWTYSNIAYFGGHANNITIAGESAGGTLVSMLPVIESTHPYFSKLILFSGLPTSILSKTESQARTKSFLETLNLSAPDQISALSLKHLIASSSTFMKKSNLGSGSFQPSVDHVLISEPPISLLAKGHGKPIPMLIGSTQDELSVIEHPLLKHHWDFSPALQEGLSLENEAFIRKIQSLYNDYYGAKLGRIQFFSDILFKSAGLFYGQAASSKSPVWFYRLDYRPSRMDMTRLGAFHSSQLPLIFGNLKKGLGKAMFGLSRKLDEPKSIAGSMQEDIVRFMENGVLPWQQATPSLQESKIYNDKIQYQPMIPNKLYALLKQTDYYKRTQDHTYAEKRHQLAKKK